MNFSDIKRDIHKLIGLELNSINRGTPVTIEDIDDNQDRLIIKPKDGNLRSRPMSELMRIWDAMQREPAVHVDRVLNGSGTSRNQPETILANLPYIEWLRIDKKKHIAYVGESTHPYGTLREMNSIKAVEITSQLKLINKRTNFSSIIVSKDVNACISYFQDICRGRLSTVEQGIYQIETNNDLILFLSSETMGLDEGTYCVIDAHKYETDATAKRLMLHGQQYVVICTGSIKILLKE